MLTLLFLNHISIALPEMSSHIFPLSSGWHILIWRKVIFHVKPASSSLFHWMTPGLKETFYGHFKICYCFKLLTLYCILYFLYLSSIFINNTVTKGKKNSIKKLNTIQFIKMMLMLTHCKIPKLYDISIKRVGFK